MEKTYKFELPQSKEVESTKVRVEDGIMFVDVKFKERFEPKEGDFCVSDTGLIFIVHNTYNVGKQIRAFSYIGESDNNKEIFKNLTYTINNGRFATPEEKADFLARLEKECGKRWNPETKTLEQIRWRAKKNEYYYAMTPDFTVARYMEEYSVFDNGRYNACNYFKTPKEAQPYADKVKEMFKNA